jgi:hypothetical protein
MRNRFSNMALSVVCLALGPTAFAQPPGENKFADPNVKSAQGSLWVDPEDIQSRNLLYGAGGKEHQPTGTTFTFVDEDLNGSNPKYNVKDPDGVKWKIKLGAEAQPETAASRLLWAVGYFATEDYFLPSLTVSDLPAHLHRGQNQIGPGGTMQNARLKRHLKGEEKAGNWSWHDAPFAGTREWNGLRVMMALLNNWDLKDSNNAVYQRGADKIYLVSDLGASFGTTGFNPKQDNSKGNLHNYAHSQMIGKITSEHVDFNVPSRPNMFIVFNPAEFIPRMDLRWIGKQVPRADARWMGDLLARLSPEQIRDAFRAAGYSPEETEGFAQVVERRIKELTAL